MVTGLYLLGRILVGKILYNPSTNGLELQINEKMINNFKVLSTVLYNSFLEYITDITRNL